MNTLFVLITAYCLNSASQSQAIVGMGNFTKGCTSYVVNVFKTMKECEKEANKPGWNNEEIDYKNLRIKRSSLKQPQVCISSDLVKKVESEYKMEKIK